jgi:hypothetical protein
VKLINELNSENQNIVVEVVSNGEKLSHKLLEIIDKGYNNFCVSNCLDCKTVVSNESIKFYISGLNAKKLFINESGMQSVENGQEKGICQVFVYENIVDKIIDDKDIVVTACRSSGAGGQHINTTDSAIRAVHIRTGISAVCQDERSQVQNKEKAIECLKIKVKDHYKREKQKQIDNAKKQLIKSMNKHKFVKIYNLSDGVIYNTLQKQSIDIYKDFVVGKKL